MRNKSILYLMGLLCCCVLVTSGCKKYLQIAPPISTLTTGEVFNNNKQAEWAIAGVYSKMINGDEPRTVSTVATTNFASGLATLCGSLSSDEMIIPTGDPSRNALIQNQLTAAGTSYTQSIWRSAYRLIYETNAVLEGLEASRSSDLTDSVKHQLTGEALALRAFGYFYLVNFFGDVPLVLTTDFNKTVNSGRTPVNDVYNQIKADLERARPLLSDNFKVGNNEKVRVTKWFVEALLARVYLFTGAYQNAINSASVVIDQKALFDIEMDVNKVFLKNSTEAIFQLKQTNENSSLRNATPEGYTFYLTPNANITKPNYALSEQLENAFEANDKRKTGWTIKFNEYYAPAKYKTGSQNGTPNAAPLEYYTVMRLAELYLIRAEANLLLSASNKDIAIDDLNVIRRRADVPELLKTLSATQVEGAVAQERRVELFMEWGHRWFDLKRTGKAGLVLPQVAYKMPWAGDHQLLYPIPVGEMEFNQNLKPNPGYSF